MEYKHINDCWDAVRQAETYDELEEVIWDFPRWSGDWEIVNEDGYCCIINSYYDENTETWDEDEEDTDIPYPNNDEEE